MGLLLRCEPRELDFPFEVNKELVSSIRLINKTWNHVAFELLITQSRKTNYGVQPRFGIIPPGASCVITVKMKALRSTPTTIWCKDKFMLRSVVTNPGTSTRDAQNLFDQKASNLIQESLLNVVFSFPLAQVPPTPIQCTTECPLPITPEVTDPISRTYNNNLQVDYQLAETPTKWANVQKLLEVQPSELQFPLKWAKDFSQSFQLSNTSEHHVAFMIKTANPVYSIQPSSGIVVPQSKCDITVRLQEQKKTSDMKCVDKFLIQSVLSSPPMATEDLIIPDLFNNVGSTIDEHEIQVVRMLEEKKSVKARELICKGGTIIFMVLASCCLMKLVQSLIWSLIVAMKMLMMKMITRLVSEWIEDWVVKTLLCVILPIVFKWIEALRLPSESLQPF